MHITLTGPCAPVDLLDLLDEEGQARAQSFKGYQGIPVSSLARALIHCGHLVSVVSASYLGIKGPESFHGDCLTIHVVPGRGRARECALDMWSAERRAMAELLRGLQPDIVHAHWTYEFALAALDSQLPTLVTAHDAPLTVLRHFRDPYRTARLALALRVAAKRPTLTAVSPYLAERWHREMRWRRDIAVIPNIAPFVPNDQARKIHSPQRLVTVGDGSRLKNVRAGIEAWPMVLQSCPTAELHVVGFGLGPSEDLASWAEQHDLQRQVFWHGPISHSDMEGVMGCATALLHPSLEETGPLVAIEAMAGGVPIIGGDASGGLPWTVADAGVLTDVRSPSALAATIVDLLKDPDLCADLGQRGKRRVAEVFSPETVADAYEKQYAAVLAP